MSKATLYNQIRADHRVFSEVVNTSSRIGLLEPHLLQDSSVASLDAAALFALPWLWENWCTWHLSLQQHTFVDGMPVVF